ncbi:hypothetical protein SELMODRAFT_176218 [Selaginella moellendorffii]|uniref:RING-type domain-containing protein n=1 Tax=Selaginella moellendorffii TaxID=88036 RepID=D8S1V7_SELML|nr:E3 ubiquitin-protein ligase RGLG2 [Selaginella moellendorffii]EFJ21520.1 hypothetical protein SELMODRAFT_176218 [Selaginella moellendorffii]|eukprot:XP_002977516.1 E3 ubiquitin-protein ligase RGLG2 [Selaginella moellendorffii]
MGSASSKSSTSTYYAEPSPRSSSNEPSPRGLPKSLDRRFSSKYSHIGDQFGTIEQVQEALHKAGLESSNLIVGIDFTKSNEWTGKRTFNGRSLHALGDHQNPYEQAISIIGRTLSKFDEDNLIPCFGFGDASTHDEHVFGFYPEQRPCQGFEEALSRYREIAPNVRLAGPTSFAPIIEAAMDIVEQSGGQYHVLLIIADGQVTRSVDVENGTLSPQEQSTVDAIVAASNLPLSIVLVGVGDGPWDMMRQFDDNIPQRLFDNFQFVNFSEIMSKGAQREASFALQALMEIPAQYRATMELEILGQTTGSYAVKKPLSPPQSVLRADAGRSNSSAYSRPPAAPPTPPQAAANYEHQLCPICLSERKDLAFGCGHQTCRDCGKSLANCPICRQRITTRIRLY